MLQLDMEQAMAILEDDQIKEVENKLQNALVCKILTSKVVNVEVFRTIMPAIWNSQEEVRIQNVDFNINLCIFKTPKDKQVVVENGPWFFDNRLLLFQQPPRGTSKFIDIDFQYASFWVHFHRLPMACFSWKMAIALGSLVGRFEKVDTDDEGMCWGRTLRVRVSIDVKKPLRRVVKLKVGSMGEETLIPVTYEKLMGFCYECGKLGYVLVDCNTHSNTAEEDLPYGDRPRGMRREGDEKFNGIEFDWDEDEDEDEDNWEEEDWEEDSNDSDDQNLGLPESESALNGPKLWDEKGFNGSIKKGNGEDLQKNRMHRKMEEDHNSQKKGRFQMSLLKGTTIF